MRIFLNGAEAEVRATRLDAALAELGYSAGPFATAVNESFVHRENRAETVLAEGDRIEVVAPLQGG
ncbi:MAG: sulfur carrier protein ThiS [Pseudomonadota bacterium]